MTGVSRLLASVTGQLDGGGETRDGQLAMAEAIQSAIADLGDHEDHHHDGTDDEAGSEGDTGTGTGTRNNTDTGTGTGSDNVGRAAPTGGSRATGDENYPVVIVEAGTGTGKSLAYLTPIVASGRRTVVATATIALQGQLVDSDVPTVARGLGRPVTAAVLKGRSNYVCNQRLSELRQADRNEQLELLAGRDPDHGLKNLLTWADQTTTGDREELDQSPPSDLWRAVSVSGDECPGAARCPSGDECFSEAARRTAMAADVIVTNQHYYGLHLASGGALIGEHDVVVFDEAHQLPDILGSTCGTEMGGGRLRAVAGRVRSILTDEALRDGINRSADEFDRALENSVGQALSLDGDLVNIIVLARDRVERALAAVQKLDPTPGSTVAARVDRVTRSLTRFIVDIDRLLESGDDDVVWVDGSPKAPVLRLTPLDLGPMLADHLWSERVAVLTSATLPTGFGAQLGIDSDIEVQRVGSPFDYDKLGLLYCPTDLPPPRHADFRAAVQDELIGLIKAAGGRTLALFTSYSAMAEAAERLRDELPNPVLVQGEGSKATLIERFRSDSTAVLAATMSFWQGIDLPGSTLTLVTIDRIPFPRPDDPVLQARRDSVGARAFRQVDLPRAQTLLAQAAGRLIRRSDDRGVVAVLDSRLATNRGYRWDLINALPPLRRTKDRNEVYTFLRDLDDTSS